MGIESRIVNPVRICEDLLSFISSRGLLITRWLGMVYWSKLCEPRCSHRKHIKTAGFWWVFDPTHMWKLSKIVACWPLPIFLCMFYVHSSLRSLADTENRSECCIVASSRQSNPLQKTVESSHAGCLSESKQSHGQSMLIDCVNIMIA